ncbi:putative undecaprenyl-phosphate glycosyl-1-phosphate transferase [Euzebya pacifica]|uniref:Putative undecaprenyl-phosphate glycosyl-1-phosphate transferase n=1 Tax=Euzebya pacifica TaxID=1608957 RepID=A0A346Y040_9ACTN|nr:sugar transferase [Euzebya pacifica]AXV07837.1 putative undecaprenyl-phosphate glycosyl-1-phosphate transferase [Euzebya pacifica]
MLVHPDNSPSGSSADVIDGHAVDVDVQPASAAGHADPDVVAVVAAPRVVSEEEKATIARLQAQVDGTDRPDGTYVKVIKPALDRFAGGVLLLLTLPLLLAGMLAVRVTMGKGVIFRQERIGLDGRRFTVLKLRTMGHDRRSTSQKDLEALAEGRWDGIERRQTHKTDADPRHTGVGRTLRKLSIDELPQLINVVRGDMSLVGPRPELPVVINRHYEPWMHRRHAVKPGVTGLWQISMRGEGDMHEHVDVDLDYVDRVSLREDLRILFATPFAALGAHKGV